MPEVITHRLDLLLRCIDTTTGNIIGEGVRFFRDGVEKIPAVKPEGYYLLIGTGREDFELEVQSFGFEPMRCRVEYDALDKNLPLLELALIPNLYYQNSSPCHTLAGQLEGITALDAVRLEDGSCLVREFDARKKILTVFNPHHLELDRVNYAVVNPVAQTYEPFAIVARISDKTFSIDRALTMDFSHQSPVSRLIFGTVDEWGQYLLRVRDTASQERWLVRYRVAGRQAFQIVDFSDPNTTALAMPAAANGDEAAPLAKPERKGNSD